MDARLHVAAMVVLIGCEQVTRLELSDACVVPDEVQRVFDESCATSGCHGTQGTVQAGLSLADGRSDLIIGRSSTQLTSLPLVEIGDVSGSYLAIKIEDGLPGAMERMRDPMPPTGKLTEEDRAFVIAWIAGAQFRCDESGDSSSTDASSTSTSTDESTTSTEPPACGIDDLKPGATNPIDAGTDAGQIPPDIAGVLADNCGCHYVDELEVEGQLDYPSASPLHIDTLAGFDETLSTSGGPAHESVSARLTGAPPMPPATCAEIVDADRDLLLAWLDAGHPDGATWSR